LNGTLCVKSPIKRTPSVVSGRTAPPFNDCTGLYTIDMNALASGLLGGTPLAALKTPGTQVNCHHAVRWIAVLSLSVRHPAPD
jgi:hypothetical protein